MKRACAYGAFLFCSPKNAASNATRSEILTRQLARFLPVPKFVALSFPDLTSLYGVARDVPQRCASTAAT